MSTTNALQKTGGVLNGFKEFISRGNAVDLAVGVVIGAAFGAVIDSIVTSILEPLIAAIFGKPDLTGIWTWNLNGAAIQPFAVVTALINFLLVAAAIYFLVVMPLNALAAKRAKTEEEPAPEEKSQESILLTEIRDLLASQKPQV
ncbi:large conductance mechanosensitive channel [Salana multivorans]|uniref:Large-conductance mechanosensitive channel n=1 Tax=Salana multivorans TaxID=120377 RepID=A0A3N2D834_9MICO|nr:large conductance mechanosensitive channel protein MscL [Salana multivorans]MBN8883652.1 large conductance mechanosensitive channel protein MscL [Salana multivorans]OJX94037.1 MAG: hypothetical protein BGO96_09520 [Micrococcales bacterium 73-15]ROR95937.1 large conductance mechanosensitive channel [Salana multivorans]